MLGEVVEADANSSGPARIGTTRSVERSRMDDRMATYFISGRLASGRTTLVIRVAEQETPY